MACRVIEFPVLVKCPVCKKSCSEGDLSECTTCDDKFCGQCHECSCDRVAADLAERLKQMREPRRGFGMATALRERATAYLRFSLMMGDPEEARRESL